MLSCASRLCALLAVPRRTRTRIRTKRSSRQRSWSFGGYSEILQPCFQKPKTLLRKLASQPKFDELLKASIQEKKGLRARVDELQAALDNTMSHKAGNRVLPRVLMRSCSNCSILVRHRLGRRPTSSGAELPDVMNWRHLRQDCKLAFQAIARASRLEGELEKQKKMKKPAEEVVPRAHY